MTSYNAQIVVAGNGSTTASTFYPIAGDLTSGLSTTESQTQLTVRDSGTFSNLFVNIDANSANATSTIRTRKNGVNGNQSVSIPASTTGNFEDAVNSDSVVSGDKVGYAVTYGGTSGLALIPTVLSCLYTSSSATNTVTFLFDSSLSVMSTTGNHFSGLNSVVSSNATESNAALFPEITTTSTFSNLFVNVISNSDSSFSHTVTSRKNSAAGAMSVSIAASTTGILEDTTHSDSIISTDSFDLLFSASSISGSLTVNVGVTMINTSATYLMAGSDPNGFTGAINSNLTRSFPVSGSPLKQAVESTVQMKTRNTSLSAKNLSYNISANTLNAASTLSLRKNGANVTNNTASIAASTTGSFTKSAIDTLSSTDLINYQLVTTASTTGSITLVDVHISGFRSSVANTATISEPSISVSAAVLRKPIPKITITPTSITASVSIIVKRKASESLTSTSSIKRMIHPIMTEPSNSITATATRLKGHFFTKVESTSISATTSILVKRKAQIESISITPSFIANRIPIIREPSISTTDSISTFKTEFRAMRSVSDSILTTDSVSRNVSIHITVTEIPFYPQKDKVDSTYISHKFHYLFKFGSRYRRF